MTIRHALVASIGLCGLALAASLVIGPSLPDIVPTHWNGAGQVDGRGPKGIMLYMMPAIMAGMMLLMAALPSLSPKKFEIDSFIDTYAKVWIVLEALFLGMHLLFLQAVRHEGFDISRWLFAVMFLFFALIGNWMGKMRRNFYMGIRTPWTLADERVWDQTHRVAGRIWFFGGIIGAVLLIIGFPWWLGLCLLMILSFYPIYLSWAIYQKLVR